MDILNFISWIRGRRQVTSVDPAKTLIPVGLKDGRRDDDYIAGAISVEDFTSQIKPYKVYTALLTQTGTDAPVATVLENTLGGAPAWSYDSVGYYKLTLTNAFNGNIMVRVGNEADTDIYCISFPNSYTNNEINLFTSSLTNIGGGDNDLLNKTSIEIRVYN
jgi:hypothetical protein